MYPDLTPSRLVQVVSAGIANIKGSGEQDKTEQ